MTVPYYAEPGFSPPPFLETLGVIEDLTDTKCWRCDLVRCTCACGLQWHHMDRRTAWAKFWRHAQGLR